MNIQLFLANRMDTPGPDRPVPGSVSDLYINIQKVEDAPEIIRSYLETFKIHPTEWMGGQLFINNAYQGAYSHNGKFWRPGSLFGDMMMEWHRAWKAERNIKRLTLLN